MNRSAASSGRTSRCRRYRSGCNPRSDSRTRGRATWRPACRSTTGRIASANTSLTSKPPSMGRCCRRRRPGSWPVRASGTRPEPSQRFLAVLDAEHQGERSSPPVGSLRLDCTADRCRGDRLHVGLMLESRGARVSGHLRRDRAEAAEQIRAARRSDRRWRRSRHRRSRARLPDWSGWCNRQKVGAIRLAALVRHVVGPAGADLTFTPNTKLQALLSYVVERSPNSTVRRR